MEDAGAQRKPHSLQAARHGRGHCTNEAVAPDQWETASRSLARAFRPACRVSWVQGRPRSAALARGARQVWGAPPPSTRQASLMVHSSHSAQDHMAHAASLAAQAGPWTARLWPAPALSCMLESGQRSPSMWDAAASWAPINSHGKSLRQLRRCLVNSMVTAICAF